MYDSHVVWKRFSYYYVLMKGVHMMGKSNVIVQWPPLPPIGGGDPGTGGGGPTIGGF